MAVVIDRVWPHDPFHDDQLPDGLDDPTNPAVMDYHKHKDDKLEKEDNEDQEPEDTEPDGTEELLQLAQQPLCTSIVFPNIKAFCDIYNFDVHELVTAWENTSSLDPRLMFHKIIDFDQSPGPNTRHQKALLTNELQQEAVAMCTPSPLSAPVKNTKDSDTEVSGTKPIDPTAPVPRQARATDLPPATDSVGLHNSATTPATTPKLETLDEPTTTTNLPFKQELAEDSEEETNDAPDTSGNEPQSSWTALEKCIHGCHIAHLPGAICPKDPTGTPSHANTSDPTDREHPAGSLYPTAQATPEKSTLTTNPQENPLDPDRQNSNTQIQPESPSFSGFTSSVANEARNRFQKIERHKRSMALSINTPESDEAIALRQRVLKIRKQQDKEAYIQASKTYKLQEKEARSAAKRKSKVAIPTTAQAATTSAAPDTEEHQDQGPSLIDKLRKSTRTKKVPKKLAN